jgi:hypothetical protein
MKITQTGSVLTFQHSPLAPRKAAANLFASMESVLITRKRAYAVHDLNGERGRAVRNFDAGSFRFFPNSAVAALSTLHIIE